ncbi:MAG: hypothetical protein FJ215_01745 [Ignavibacteria bacterium]|nr:hypothetical protein [Ignavibacteria bacterium]
MNNRAHTIKQRWLFIGLVLASLLLIGCVDEPSPVGSSLLPRADLLRLDTLTLSASKTFGKPALYAPFGQSRLLIGRNDNLQYESWGLIRFTSIPDSLYGIVVQEASLHLRTSYHHGDSLAPFAFRIHRAERSWMGDSLSYDSIKAAGFSSATTSPVVQFSGLSDSMRISVPLEPRVVQRWIDSLFAITSNNEGLILEPLNSAVIKGFSSFTAADTSHRPRLVITYKRPQDSSVASASLMNGFSRHVATMKNRQSLTDSTTIYVRNGLVYRGVVGFDISPLPPRAPVHRAVLELTLDKSKSVRNSYSVDSLFVIYLTDFGYVEAIFESSETPVTIDGQTVFRFPLQTFVQRWVRGGLPYQLAIAGINEGNAFDVMAFHGSSSPDKNKRPRITVTYSPLR